MHFIYKNSKGSAPILVTVMLALVVACFFHSMMIDNQSVLQAKVTKRNKINFQNLMNEMVMVLSNPSACQLNLGNHFISLSDGQTIQLVSEFQYGALRISSLKLVIADKDAHLSLEGGHTMDLLINADPGGGSKHLYSKIPMYVVAEFGGKISSCRATSVDGDATLERSLCGTHSYDPATSTCI